MVPPTEATASRIKGNTGRIVPKEDPNLGCPRNCERRASPVTTGRMAGKVGESNDPRARKPAISRKLYPDGVFRQGTDKMKKLICALLTSLLATSVAAEKSLTLDNCGKRITFQQPPERVVSIGQAGTEILYSLGLGDKVVGTGVWFTEVLGEFQTLNAGVKRLADNDPSFESILAQKPQLVTSQFEWHIGPQGTIATREQFHELDVPTYILPTDCVGKDNSTGDDGTRTAMFSTELIHQEVHELARIFGVPGKGEQLVSQLKTREQNALERVKGLNLKDVSAVFWFSSPEMEADPYVAGRKGAPGYIMHQLDVRNVIQSDEEWPTVGWETIARANPTVIVIAKMQRRRYPADDYRKKLEFLKTDPVTRHMDAVRKGRIIVLDAHAMDATIRTVGAIEVLADNLVSFELAQ